MSHLGSSLSRLTKRHQAQEPAVDSCRKETRGKGKAAYDPLGSRVHGDSGQHAAVNGGSTAS